MVISNWLFWALLSALFAALMSIFAKLGLEKVDSDVAQLFRTAIVLVAIAIPIAVSGKWNTVETWNGRIWLFIALSAIATAASWICYFRALDAGDATRVAAVDKLSVALVAVVAAVFLQERLGWMGWGGVVLVSVGLVMIGHAK